MSRDGCVWLFLAVPWVRLRFVIVVFPDHTDYFCLVIGAAEFMSRPVSCLAQLTLYSLASSADNLFQTVRTQTRLDKMLSLIRMKTVWHSEL